MKLAILYTYLFNLKFRKVKFEKFGMLLFMRSPDFWSGARLGLHRILMKVPPISRKLLYLGLSE